MVQLSIEVPDELALRLESVKDRLIEILESGYDAVVDDGGKLHEEVIDFLATGPSPEQIVAFRPTQANIERVSTLLSKNRQGTLSVDEEAELDKIEAHDHLMVRVKARARSHIQTEHNDKSS